MASVTSEVDLTEKDMGNIAHQVFELMKPLLDPANHRCFLNENEAAQWLGISVTTLRRLRWAGLVCPSRTAPLIGYSQDDRLQIVALMSDPVRWPEAMEKARTARANPEK